MSELTAFKAPKLEIGKNSKDLVSEVSLESLHIRFDFLDCIQIELRGFAPEH